MSVTACQVITKVDEEILVDESKWNQHQYYDYDGGSHCLIGAVVKAACPDYWTTGRSLTADERKAYDGTINVITGLIARDGFGAIQSWNDDPNRTFGEVKSLIKQAREKICA